MILPPLNDHACLGSITDVVRGLVTERDPTLVALAATLATPAEAIRWMRALPQRDDTGQPDDGPKVDACAPPQRLRLPAPDPNCVERAALYLVLGELLDPAPARRLATIETPLGRHTLPVERERPVVLDPRVARNCAHAGVDAVVGAALPTALDESAAWVTRIAAEPLAQLPGGTRRLRNGRTALVSVAGGAPVPPSLADDAATVLALAAREATRWGDAGRAVVARVVRAVVDLADATTGRARGHLQPADLDARNGLELRIGRYRLRPAVAETLRAALRTLGKVGTEVGPTMIQTTLATMGVTPPMLGIFEQELNREGLTLGPIARPAPPLHAFAALSGDAIAQRHRERAGTP